MKTVSTCITDHDYELLKKISDVKGMTISWLVREILRNYILSESSILPPQKIKETKVSGDDIEKRFREIEERVSDINKKLESVISTVDKILSFLYQLEREKVSARKQYAT